MCGINGIINLTGRSPDLNRLRSSTKYLKSRGPDDEGYWIDKGVGLAHRRLSIIDLTDTGHQPMISNDENKVIVFNGEIYNYKHLRSELAKSGFAFRSHTDTEVLLTGYEAWGINELLKRIDGMFAFCIFDVQRNQIFFARDRFGKKPLYYSVNEKEILFSSDIRCISEYSDRLTVDLDSLDFFFQELGVPQPKSIWKEIKQVEPGSFFTIDLKDKKIEQKRYYSFNFQKRNLTIEETLDEVERKLTKAILKRTVADVPVSCFLSGGVDSGLIVALLAQNSYSPVNTFTVEMDNKDYNEGPYASRLSERYGTNHQSIVLRGDQSYNVAEILDEMGEPFADSSLIPSYMICKEMRKNYKVALSGDGGDELFGYPNYTFAYELERFIKANPDRKKRKRKIFKSKILSRMNLSDNYGKFGWSDEMINSGELLRRNMMFSNSEMTELLNFSSVSYTQKYLSKYYNEIRNSSSITDNVIGGSLHSRLLNDYLVKIDRASMMNSLEVRSPFLDIELSELAFSIPHDVLFKNNTAKYLLKKLAEKYIDPDIFIRQKSGFGIPLADWLRNNLKPLLMDLLSENNLKKHGLFDENYVNKILKNHIENQQNHQHQLWGLLTFQYWYIKYGQRHF